VSRLAQLGYTVSFMLVHAGRYRRQITNRHTTKTKYNNAKYSRTKLPGLVASYDTRPGNEVGLFYKAPEPTRGCKLY